MTAPRYPFRVLLVPADFSASSEAALALAAEIARTHAGRLVLLHVSDVGAALALDAAMSAASMGISAAVGVDQQRQEHIRSALEATAARLSADGLQVDVVAAEGSPEARIPEIADERSVDVIVMGTQGRSGFEQLLAGSVAEKVVRGASVPVLVVRG